MPSGERKNIPFTKQMSTMRTSWCVPFNCCAGCCLQSHTHQRPNSSQFQGLGGGPTNSTGGGTNNVPPNSSGTQQVGSGSNPSRGGCCFGMSPIVVIRLTFLVAFLTLAIVSIFYFHELKHAFLDTLVYIRELGPLRGSVVLIIANIIGALLFMPCVPFTLGAGFLYGTFVGSIIVSIASTVAAVIAFLCARYLARVWIEKSLGGKASRFRILDNAISQDGFRIVLLIRSSPLHPYGVFNYLFGLTSVTGRDYTVASFLGMLPTTVMEVYLGSAGKNVADIINGNLDNSIESRVFFWAGLIVSMIVTILITVLLKRKLKAEMDKYSVVATNDDADDDEMGDFEMLGMGGGSNTVVADAPDVPEHDSALSDHLSDSESAPAEVSVAITTSPTKPTPVSGSGKLKGKPLPDITRKLVVAADGSGLKNTKRPVGVGWKSSSNSAGSSKPAASSFHAALNSPPLNTVPAKSIASPPSGSSSKSSTPRQSKVEIFPLGSPTNPGSTTVSPTVSAHEAEDETQSESEALIDTERGVGFAALR